MFPRLQACRWLSKTATPHRLLRVGFSQRHQTSGSRRPPPPPPPPPPRHKKQQTSSQPKGNSKSGNSIAAPLGAVAAVGVLLAGAFYYQQQQRNGTTSPLPSIRGSSVVQDAAAAVSNAMKSQPAQESATDYLRKEMERGDESIKPVLSSLEDSQKPLPPAPKLPTVQVATPSDPADFRFDCSRTGLLDSLTIMLDVKREEEKQIVSDVYKRKGTMSENNRKLRELREEKAEIKRYLKALKRQGD